MRACDKLTENSMMTEEFFMPRAWGKKCQLLPSKFQCQLSVRKGKETKRMAGRGPKEEIPFLW